MSGGHLLGKLADAVRIHRAQRMVFRQGFGGRAIHQRRADDDDERIEAEPGDGVLVVTGSGHDESVPHPAGKGKMHFVHLGLKGRLFESGIAKLYVYRLEGVQVKGMAAKPAG